MFHRNQKVVIQKFIIELTGDKYFSVIPYFMSHLMKKKTLSYLMNHQIMFTQKNK